MANKKTTSSKSTTSKKATAKKKQVQLEDLQQTNGKSYEDQVAKARELEDILGIAKINPFKTNDKRVFADMLQDMNLTDLQAFAVKVGVFPAGNKTVLKNKIKHHLKTIQKMFVLKNSIVEEVLPVCLVLVFLG